MRLRVLGVLSVLCLVVVFLISGTILTSASRELTQELQINRAASLNRLAQVAFDAAGDGDTARLQREMDTMRATLQMPTLFVVAPDGTPLAFSPLAGPDGTSNLALRYADRPLFQEAIRTERPAISGIIYGRASRDFIVGAAVPIWLDRQVVAYLLGSIRLRASIEAIEQAAAGPGGWLVMIDAEQRAIYLDSKTRQITQADWKGHPVVRELSRRKPTGIVELDDGEWLATQAVMPTLRVNLVWLGSVRSILESQRAVLLTLGATLLVSLAMSLAVATVVAMRFVREQQAQATGKTHVAVGT